jgi:Cft2 family RNA processing exonuclease
VNYRHGVELPAHGLWLDPHHARPLAFVSHAHSDHLARHREVILTPGTSLLMRQRLSGERVEHIVPFGGPVELPCLPGVAVRLLSAGHVLGSAQIHLETADGSLLYSGDFKLQPGLSSEPAECLHAETLVMETTFGLPRYRFPPAEAVIGDILTFCREALEENAVPVLLSYSLGKSQEILCALLRNGFEAALHPAVFRVTEVYRALQETFPAGYTHFHPGGARGKVVIWPPNALRARQLQQVPNKRVAVLTGWALDASARYRYGADAAFPLSDHAGYDDLLRYVELVQPRRVLTLHGYAAAFARDLRAKGIEAWALDDQNQLELSL